VNRKGRHRKSRFRRARRQAVTLRTSEREEEGTKHIAESGQPNTPKSEGPRRKLELDLLRIRGPVSR